MDYAPPYLCDHSIGLSTGTKPNSGPFSVLWLLLSTTFLHSKQHMRIQESFLEFRQLAVLAMAYHEINSK